jgi:hypothetical protein
LHHVTGSPGHAHFAAGGHDLVEAGDEAANAGAVDYRHPGKVEDEFAGPGGQPLLYQFDDLVALRP